MKLFMTLMVCAVCLTACQTTQDTPEGLTSCVSTGAAGTTNVICP
ncbi:hypothetical protein [Kaistia adipata]|nr:hypothetical protein [Kaistia adipata]